MAHSHPTRARVAIFLALSFYAAGALVAQDARAALREGRRTEAPRFATTRQAPDADAYGTGTYTVTTINAMSFVPFDPNDTYISDLCCLSRAFADGDGELYSSVSIPAGVVIDYIGLESYSFCAGVVGVELWEVDHGQTSGIASFSSSAHSYGSDFNASPISYLNSTNTGKALAIQVELANNCLNWPAVSWVEIWWRRVVSDPPGTATFNDVPTSHPFFQFIEALNAAGITGGCGNGNYCPDGPVTRGQMAVFLSKALGLHWPG
jgi:hypothetical protein